MPAHTPVRLAIIDDHELLATALALALRLAGLDVETFTGPSAKEVAAAIRKRAPVLVLLDLNLGPPLGSGLDLIQPLIAAGGRVLMMTGVDDGARLGACIEAGAAGIISKSAGLGNMIEVVRRAVEGEELLTDNYRARLLNDLRAQRRALGEAVAAFADLTHPDAAPPQGATGAFSNVDEPRSAVAADGS